MGLVKGCGSTAFCIASMEGGRVEKGEGMVHLYVDCQFDKNDPLKRPRDTVKTADGRRYHYNEKR